MEGIEYRVPASGLRRLAWSVGSALGKATEVACLLLMLTLVGAVTVGALGRAVGAVIPWSDEVARAAFIALVFLGGALAVRSEAHLRVLFVVVSIRNERARWLLGAANHLFMAATGVLLVVLGMQIVGSSAESSQRTTVLGIPLALIYAVVPASGALFILFAIELLLGHRAAEGSAESEQRNEDQRS